MFIARSAKRVIVSVEEVVPTDVVMKNPARTVLPGFFVHGVVESRLGAHPCACDLRYDYATGFTDTYYEASKNSESFKAFLDEYVYSVQDHDSYLEKVKVLERP